MASLLVVLFHMAGVMGLHKYFGVKFGEIFGFGDAGVEFFFVLSGFIITWVHTPDLGRPAKVVPYLRKRVVRIYPAYSIIFAVTFLMMFCFDRNSVPHDFPTLFRSLALLPQDTAVIGGVGSPVVMTAWSLQYEMLFYALASVFILSPLAGTLLVLLFLVNFAACHTGVCTFPRSFAANNLMLLFAFGAFIAWLCRRGVELHQPLLVAAIGVAVFLLTAAFEIAFGRDMQGIDRRLVYGLWRGVIILGLVRAEATGKLKIDSGWILLLGDASYSLYLIHFPIIVALCKLAMYTGTNGFVGAVVYYPIILAACVSGALAFYIYIEEPILGYFRDRSASADGGPAIPGVSVGRSAQLQTAPGHPSIERTEG